MFNVDVVMVCPRNQLLGKSLKDGILSKYFQGNKQFFQLFLSVDVINNNINVIIYAFGQNGEKYVIFK